MSDWDTRTRNEKDEKQEKEHEKEEKSRSDPLSTIVWAAILIWVGLVLLADNLGLLDAVARTIGSLPGARTVAIQTWSVILLGAGAILLVEVVARLSLPAYRQPIEGTLVFAAILIAMALGSIFGWTVVLPLGLIIVGLMMLVGALLRRPRE